MKWEERTDINMKWEERTDINMKWEERKKYYDKDYYDTDIKPPYRGWWWSDPSVWAPRAKAIFTACQPKTLLDCGCAKGSLVKFLVSLYKVDACGFDLSEYAINTTPYPEILNRLKIVDCAENNLPYEDAQFDVSVCVDFFEHQDNEHLKHVISEIERVTKEFIIIMEGRELEERFSIFNKASNKNLICDEANTEHPNTITIRDLINMFDSYAPYKFPLYFYDVLMGTTYSEMEPVFPFYNTLVMKRSV
jgi:SAM-dependent methyltransferase